MKRKEEEEEQQQQKKKKKEKKHSAESGNKNSTRQLCKIVRVNKTIHAEPIKGTVHPTIYHKDREGEQMYSCILSLTSTLDEVGG